jgi:hypothetical protein
MNLLDKYNSLSEPLKQEIRIFIDNPSDIFLSPSGNKLIFQHAFESFERFEYKIFHQAVTNAGFSDDEWVLVDSNFKEDYKNILHIDFQIHRTREHLINSKNINFFPYSDKQISELKSHKRNRLFLSYHGAPHPSRIMLLHELDKRNLLQYGLVSLLRKPTDGDFEELRNKIQSDDNWGEGGEYFESAPHLLDVSEDLSEGHNFKSLNKNYYSDNVVHHSLDFPYQHLKETFFNIVPETKFFTIEENAKYIFVTEKTYKAVATQPFIVVGRPGILSHLKEHGFKTFPNMFDESYDEIEDNVERLNYIINQVEKLCNKGYDYVRDLYLESFDTVLYNQKVLYDTKNNNFEKQFDKLIKDI